MQRNNPHIQRLRGIGKSRDDYYRDREIYDGKPKPPELTLREMYKRDHSSHWKHFFGGVFYDSGSGKFYAKKTDQYGEKKIIAGSYSRDITKAYATLVVAWNGVKNPELFKGIRPLVFYKFFFRHVFSNTVEKE